MLINNTIVIYFISSFLRWLAWTWTPRTMAVWLAFVLIRILHSQTISCGETANGYISSGHFSSWTFSNPSIQNVTFTNCDSEFDTQMYLFDSQWNAIQSGSTNGCGGDDCEDTNYCSDWKKETFTMMFLPEGDYILRIRGYNINSYGNYAVELFCVPTSPSTRPSTSPSVAPTTSPSLAPSTAPSTDPSHAPSNAPSVEPTTILRHPSLNPSFNPTQQPAFASESVSSSTATAPEFRVFKVTSIRICSIKSSTDVRALAHWTLNASTLSLCS